MEPGTFSHLSLDRAILKALAEEGYTTPTDIQRQAIPHALEGKDLLAIAQTGTGKTAAFALPILHRLHTSSAGHSAGRARDPSALILTPTRELALQVAESLRAYGRHLSLETAVILGGVSAGPQIAALKRGPRIVVATPGRLLDLMSQRHVRLDHVDVFVLDEADRMLDMGFIHDVRKIAARVPGKRQTLFFSATMPPEVAELAAGLLKAPVRVDVTPHVRVVPAITQNVYFVERADKQALLSHLLTDGPDAAKAYRVLVFARTKHGANKIAKRLVKDRIVADAIHSNKSQAARQRALAAFASGKVRVLVATDIVARGIDVDGITHVFNYELTDEPENHVHRIGRTARAGSTGTACSFCDGEEILKLRAIEKLSQAPLAPRNDHPFHSETIAARYNAKSGGNGAPRGGRGEPRHARGPRGGAESRHGGAESHRGGRGTSSVWSNEKNRSNRKNQGRNAAPRKDSGAGEAKHRAERPAAPTGTPSSQQTAGHARHGQPRQEANHPPGNHATSRKRRRPFRGGKRGRPS